jgi:azurin
MDIFQKNSSDIIANTKLIGGVEIAVIEFDAPEAGVYQFSCSFPAHSVIKRGKFIVE